MSIGSLLQEYFSQKGITQVQLAKELGVSKSYVNALFAGRQRFGKKQADIWSEKFGFSRSWLLTGEGSMLMDDDEAEKDSDEVNKDDYLSDVPTEYVTYLVPIAAMGGSLSGFEDSGVMLRDCEKVISPIAGVDMAIPVCGDSMEPEYPNGSQVLVKRIHPDDFIAWGNVFVLDTTNGLIIKVVKRSDDERFVTCESLNPSGRYQPFDVPKRSIRAMYRVLMCVSLK